MEEGFQPSGTVSGSAAGTGTGRTRPLDASDTEDAFLSSPFRPLLLLLLLLSLVSHLLLLILLFFFSLLLLLLLFVVSLHRSLPHFLLT